MGRSGRKPVRRPTLHHNARASTRRTRPSGTLPLLTSRAYCRGSRPGRRSVARNASGGLTSELLVTPVPARGACGGRCDNREFSRRCSFRLDRCSLNVPLHTTQPRFFPVDAALRLASAVAGAVAAEVFEEDRVAHASAASGTDEIAVFLRPLSDAKAAAHMLEHLRHERHVVHRALAVQRREDLRGGTYLDEIARAEGPCLSGAHRTSLSVRRRQSASANGVTIATTVGRLRDYVRRRRRPKA